MKSRKFFISSALALSTVLGSVGPMMNAMPISATAVSIDDTVKDHTYRAYQIFKGKLEGQSLVEIDWGSNVDSATVIEALKGDDSPVKAKMDALGESPNAAAVANTFEGLGGDESLKLAKLLSECLSGTGTLININGTNLDAGYYLIKDETVLAEDADDIRGLNILQVGNADIAIAPKNKKPTVDKEVEDNDNHDDSNEAGFGETADHEIGETFQFRLTATIDKYEDIKNYDSYQLIFHDTLSEGVDYAIDSNLTAKVFVGDNSTAIDVSTSTVKNGQNLTVTIADLKAHLPEGTQDSDAIKVVVTYDAKLNKKAVIASNGISGVYNNNKVQLEYSNNPNGEGTGKTTEDYVYVFTYELNNTKVNNMGNNLKGAEFVLKNAAGKFASFDAANMFTGWVDAQNETTKITSDDEGKFKMTGLDAGTYTLIETRAPEGYKEAADTTIEINATHAEDEGGATAKVTLTGKNSTGATITDSKVSNLPETGGMGTTIFYAAGGILAAGAVIALAATKKAKKEED